MFSPVIKLPDDYAIFDGTGPHISPDSSLYDYGIGVYLEERPYIYTDKRFKGRVVHMGVDIQAPVGTKIYSFTQGEVLGVKNNNNNPQDYGYTLIVKYKILKKQLFKQYLPVNTLPEIFELWALYGHLGESVTQSLKVGHRVEAFEAIANIGSQEENGGWKPHLHFQLSLNKPQQINMPGVLTQKQAQIEKHNYIDPRVVLGPIY